MGIPIGGCLDSEVSDKGWKQGYAIRECLAAQISPPMFNEYFRSVTSFRRECFVVGEHKLRGWRRRVTPSRIYRVLSQFST
jgi:hypothetical protein